MDDIILNLANKVHFDAEACNHGSLDFYNVSAGSINAALEAVSKSVRSQPLLKKRRLRLLLS